MSLFREFRPLSRVFDDPFTRYGNLFSQTLDDTLYRQPAINFSEDDDHYIVEAEVPGVRRENLDLTIGEGGKSLTIEGKAEERSPTATRGRSEKSPAPAASTEVTKTATDEERQVGAARSSERFVRNMSFSRTVWLPRPVASDGVTAKLDHGVLRVELKKATDKESYRVTIN